MKDITLKVWIRVRDEEATSDDIARAVKIVLDRASDQLPLSPLYFENCSAIHVVNQETSLVLS